MSSTPSAPITHPDAPSPGDGTPEQSAPVSVSVEVVVSAPVPVTPAAGAEDDSDADYRPLDVHLPPPAEEPADRASADSPTLMSAEVADLVEEAASAVAPPAADPHAAAAAWADAALEAVLEADGIDVAMEPGPVEEALARLNAEHFTERTALYERELAEEEDKARAALLEHEIGDQLERMGGDEAGAVRAYARSLALDPMLRPNLWAVRRIFYRRKLWPSLVKLLDAEARYASSDPERAELWTERGHVLADCLGDVAGAVGCYQTAHRLDPGSLAPLAALEKIFAGRDDPQALLEIRRALVAATGEPGRRVALLIELARAELAAGGPSQGDDPEDTPIDRALAYLHGAYEAGVDQLRVVDEIIRLTEAHGRIPDCLAALDVKAEILEIQSEGAPPPRQQALGEEIITIRRWQAALARDRLRDGQLCWQYLQAANARSPGDPLIINELIEAAEALGRWDDLEALLGLLHQRRQAASGEAAPPVGLLLQRARALRLSGREAEAEELEGQVGGPGAARLPMLLLHERRALQRDEMPALAAIYEEEAEAALAGGWAGEAGDKVARPDRVWAAGALLRAAGCQLRAGEHDRAAALLERAREVAAAPSDDKDSDVVQAQEREQDRLGAEMLALAYERAGRWPALAALLEEELGRQPTPLRARRLHALLADVYGERLNEPGKALAHNAALCAGQPDDLQLWLQGADLARRAGDAAAEAEALRQADRLAGAGGVRRLEWLLRRAELLAGPLKEGAAALNLYEEVLRQRPDDPEALAAVERLYEDAGRHGDLQRLLRRQADASAVVDLGGQGGAVIAESGEAHRLLALQVKLAEVAAGPLGQPHEAAAVWRDVLIRRPGYPPALRALCRLYRRLHDGGRLAGTLELLSEAVPAGATRADTLLRLGEVYEDLARAGEAEDAYARALAQVPQLEAGEARPASPGEGGGAPAKPPLIDATSGHALLGRLRVAARRRDPHRLADVYEAMGQGLSPREQAHLAEERAFALGQAPRGASSSADDRQTEVLLRLAQAAWQPAHPSLEPPVPLPELGLWRHAAGRGDGKLAGEALARLAAALPEPGDDAGSALAPAALWLRAGVLGLLHHQEPAEQAETWRRLREAYRLAPDSAPVIGTLADALEGAGAAVLPREAAEVLRQRLALCPAAETEDRLSLCLDESAAWLARAASPGESDADLAQWRRRGAEAALRALSLDPHSVPALLLLQRATAPAIAEEDDAADEEVLRAYARVLLRLANELLDPERKAALYRQAADLLRRCGDGDGAAAALRAVLDQRPGDALAFGQLYDLLVVRGGQGDPGPLLELLNYRLAYEPVDPGERAAERPLRAALLLQRAALRQAAGQEHLAIADLRVLLNLDEDNLMARRRLADLLAEAGQASEALVHYERFLQSADRPGDDVMAAERRAVHIQAAALLSDSEPGRAAGHLQAAIAIGKKEWDWLEGGDRARLALEAEGALYRWQVRLLLSLGRPAEAVEVLGQLAALVPPGHGIELARVELEIADVLHDQAGDLLGARDALVRALAADPLSLEALDRLVPLCTELAPQDPAARDLAPQHLHRALAEARIQAAAQPPSEISGEPYHALAQVFHWLGQEDAHHLAKQAEAAISGMAPPPAPLREPTKALSPLGGVIGCRAFSPEARGLVLDLWREIAETANTMLGPDLAALGTSPRERLNARAVPEVWAGVERLARALGLGPGGTPYGLYLSRERELCQLSGTNLVCGSAFATPLGELPPRLGFRLAQRLVLLPDRLGPVLGCGSEDLLLFFAACCRLAEVRGPELLPVHASKLEERVRALGKAISRKEKKALLGMAGRLGPLGGSPGRELVGGWQQAVILGASRLALAMTGNLAGALQELGLNPREADARSAKAIHALLLFAVSGEIQELRRELGLVPEVTAPRAQAQERSRVSG